MSDDIDFVGRGRKLVKLEAAKNLWMHTNAGAEFLDDDALIEWYEGRIRKSGTVAIQDSFVKLDALGGGIPRFTYWSLRSGAQEPMPLPVGDEIMIVECENPGELKVRAVIVIDPDDGITIHNYGNIEVRSIYLDEDEHGKYF